MQHQSPTTQTIDPNENTQFFIDTLRELAVMALDIAKVIHHQVTTPTNDHILGKPIQNPAAAFDTIARAVRRTILLAEKLAQPPRNHTPSRTESRQAIIRQVEDAIVQARRGTEAQALETELHERLDAPELEDDIATRPIADIVAEIVHDLGLHNHPGSSAHKRRTPADVRDLQARAARPPAINAAQGPAHPPHLMAYAIHAPPPGHHDHPS